MCRKSSVHQPPALTQRAIQWEGEEERRTFVANESNVGQHFALKCAQDEAIPVFQVRKALVVRHVVTQEDSIGTGDVIGDHLAANGLIIAIRDNTQWVT